MAIESADDPETAKHWIVVSSVDNWQRTVDRGFTIQGLKSRHRKKAERMGAGDKIAYYVTGRKAFAGTSTIESPYFESHERIWTSGDPKKAAEDYPFRVRISPDLVLAAADYVEAEGIARRMTYTKKWPEKNWTLAFQGNVHEIDAADFEIIREAIAARAPVTADAARMKEPIAL